MLFNPDTFTRMRQIIFGQDKAVDLIEEQVEIFAAGLCPLGRPVGTFILHGPTGSGKTHTVEALAESLHGDARKYLRVDCGDHQLDHEVSKLIGSPPGYLGHRETIPRLDQININQVASDASDLSVILFDEIEKGSRALHRLLLGILDKASMALGDNRKVSFRKCIIFMTSNVGVAESTLDAASQALIGSDSRELFKGAFTPEFLNRIDAFICYSPLGRGDLERILDKRIADLQGAIGVTRGTKAVVVEVTPLARNVIIDKSNVPKWGARELARVTQRMLTRRVARHLLRNHDPEAEQRKVTVDFDGHDMVLSESEASLEEVLRASVITEEWRKRNAL